MQDFSLPTELKQSITSDIALNYRVIPEYADDNSIKFKTDNISNKSLSQELEILFDKKIELIKEESDVIDKYLTINYRTKSQNNSVSNINYSEDFLEKIVHTAKEIGSSDIHLNHLKIRQEFVLDLMEN